MILKVSEHGEQAEAPSPTEKGAEIRKIEKMVNPAVAEALSTAVRAGCSHENPLPIHGEIAALFIEMTNKVLGGAIEPSAAATETMKKLSRLLSKIRKRKIGWKKLFGVF